MHLFYTVVLSLVQLKRNADRELNIFYLNLLAGTTDAALTINSIFGPCPDSHNFTLSEYLTFDIE